MLLQYNCLLESFPNLAQASAKQSQANFQQAQALLADSNKCLATRLLQCMVDQQSIVFSDRLHKPSLNAVAYKQWSVILRFASAAENYESKADSLAMA